MKKYIRRFYRNRQALHPATKTRDIILAGALSLSFALYAFTWNHAHTHYPGVNYFVDAPPLFTLLTGLLYAGCRLQFGTHSPVTIRVREFFFFTLMLCIILIMTNAVQFTPFKPIDSALYAFDGALHLDVSHSMTWLQSYPILERWLWFCYKYLAYEIITIPLLVILAGHIEHLREYYFMMLATAFVGFMIYYFFPTTAPASILDNPRFTAQQYATGLKFWQIHHYIPPTTGDGGMISLPSYHVIWAFLCLRLTRMWALVYYPLWIYTASLIASCVLLGWHYYIDIAASFVIVGLSHHVWQRRRTP
ncbi:hypothetical protein Lgee_2126 [Legionella geestiana]|uniref:Uncharacterized protein n=1 Tax=Legionella geestiana TaxID=45065 RepID=A0A0W0TNI3_9GAMM|nr:phosphatase PAP2 family protein [Legionella geestiana]KTC97155.1 hypothetical protein Lgee_2126 [Legionella geestiana]QBS11509.1 phosphatase PAP2 family protein [Legionella geestiana]QDQ39070.1 phosphatase PAP2 family protein [Legionella geestiana]STX53827.1 Uncharacterised protein [Legionella geestiana]